MSKAKYLDVRIFIPLERMDVTNEEWGWCMIVLETLQWLEKTGEPPPQDHEALGKFLAGILKNRRAERMKALKQKMQRTGKKILSKQAKA